MVVELRPDRLVQTATMQKRREDGRSGKPSATCHQAEDELRLSGDIHLGKHVLDVAARGLCRKTHCARGVRQRLPVGDLQAQFRLPVRQAE